MNEISVNELYESMERTSKKNEWLKLDREELIKFYKNVRSAMFLDFYEENYSMKRIIQKPQSINILIKVF